MASSSWAAQPTLPGASLHPLAASTLQDIRTLRRQLLRPQNASSHAPAPATHALDRLLGLLDAMRDHVSEASARVPANESSLWLSPSVVWGEPIQGWDASCETRECASANYRAFLAPRFWLKRTSQRPDHRPPLRAHPGGARPLAPFISMFSGEDMINDCPSCGSRAAFALWQHAKFFVDYLNLIPSQVPFIGVGNQKFPNSPHNIQMESNYQTISNIQFPPFFPKPLPQIIIFFIWLILFLLIQVPFGALELIFWWLLNPWWDMIMLGFFALANALWQTCSMCDLHNCPKSTGGGGCSCVNGKPTCGAG